MRRIFIPDIRPENAAFSDRESILDSAEVVDTRPSEDGQTANPDARVRAPLGRPRGEDAPTIDSHRICQPRYFALPLAVLNLERERIEDPDQGGFIVGE